MKVLLLVLAVNRRRRDRRICWLYDWVCISHAIYLQAGNLCGLFGVFITGPMGIVLEPWRRFVSK